MYSYLYLFMQEVISKKVHVRGDHPPPPSHPLRPIMSGQQRCIFYGKYCWCFSYLVTYDIFYLSPFHGYFGFLIRAVTSLISDISNPDYLKMGTPILSQFQ